MKKQNDVTKARDTLRRLIDRACIARGEAQWTNGYRTAAYARKVDDDEYERLYAKEMGQFKYCGVAEKRMERAIAAFARAIRREL